MNGVSHSFLKNLLKIEHLFLFYIGALAIEASGFQHLPLTIFVFQRLKLS